MSDNAEPISSPKEPVSLPENPLSIGTSGAAGLTLLAVYIYTLIGVVNINWIV